MKHAIVHVADIHYRKDAPEGASSIVKAFLEDVREQIKSLPGYQFFIAFAGDIAHAAGEPGSYESFIEEVDVRLTEMGLTKNARVLVPGNHDLDRTLVASSPDDHLAIFNEHTTTESDFNDFMCTPNALHEKFENYGLFLSDFAECDDSYCPEGWGRNLTDELGVFCLNSALCSFGGLNNIDDEGRLAINTRGLVDWCNKKTTTTNILLLHHPLDHLNTWSRTAIETTIENHFILCLSGHNHRPEVYHQRIPQDSVICSAPPLFCGKEAALAYSIIRFEDGEPADIIYREYSKGKFLPGSRISKNEDGVVELGNTHLRHLRYLEMVFHTALQSFKGQPEVFIEPTLSESREFSDGPNLLDSTIVSPKDTIVVAPPQFGLTCLALYMRVQAFRQKELWIYIDAKRTKVRKVERFIDEELQRYDVDAADIKCIMIDGWNGADTSHPNMLKQIDSICPNVPIMLFSNDPIFSELTYSLSKVDRTFEVLHLQALSRSAMRDLVSGYNNMKHVGEEDDLLSHMTGHMEAINIHRTPLNCLTLLRVREGRYNEKLLNKTKLMRAILFVLFTDYESFSYSSKSPDIDACTYALGRYCRGLIERSTRSFGSRSFIKTLERICQEELIQLDVRAMVAILLENNILIAYGSTFEFKHRYWIFYFAAHCMLHDDEFKSYILEKQRYVNFPEIIDFFSGIDGKQEGALRTLMSDLNDLIDKVDSSIGIEGPFNPLSTLLWNPSESFIEETRRQIAEKVDSSNLPSEIKDRHADEYYDSEAPYDQSINKFLNKYSVISLIQSIRASSRALRNSTFVKPALKLDASSAVLRAWEELSKVLFWISPLLAKDGRAVHDGIHLILADGFSTDIDKRFLEILMANPSNVLDMVKDDLSSNNVGLLLYEQLAENQSELQKHFVAKFLLTIRPADWNKHLLEHINRLHARSFYLGNLLGDLESQIRLGFLEGNEEGQLKRLVGAVLAKRRSLPKGSAEQRKPIPANMMLSDDNKLHIDRLLAKHKPNPANTFRKKRRG